MLEGIFYSADQLRRTEVLRTTRLNNTFTPAIFHSIYNLFCQKPRLHLDSTKERKRNGSADKPSEHGRNKIRPLGIIILKFKGRDKQILGNTVSTHFTHSFSPDG